MEGCCWAGSKNIERRRLENVGAELIWLVKNTGGGQEANETFRQEDNFLGFWIIEKFAVRFATMQEVYRQNLSETLQHNIIYVSDSRKLFEIHTYHDYVFFLNSSHANNIWRKKKAFNWMSLQKSPVKLG